MPALFWPGAAAQECICLTFTIVVTRSKVVAVYCCIAIGVVEDFDFYDQHNASSSAESVGGPGPPPPAALKQLTRMAFAPSATYLSSG